MTQWLFNYHLPYPEISDGVLMEKLILSPQMGIFIHQIIVCPVYFVSIAKLGNQALLFFFSAYRLLGITAVPMELTTEED